MYDVPSHGCEDVGHLICLQKLSEGGWMTSSLPRAWRVAELLEVGMTGINTGIVSDPVAPFGGIKESGFGREGGKDGVEEFQVTKTITLGGLGVPVTPLTV
ncbi:hypothetical protein ASPBRDRAFT_199293 [Aspergillus brasiliensis CBS 101740]|uniref:Aldehyde dehydrogenase domain-containing protein n=1 Tax=Aspergillus brasiliensis (strain CBS 101740 / IMI 381727 / IBT 21946) TaxID=767769 RepID=A0A1L9U951_ASPBC|nr:hypothetical protein ASPBRDRAFT_199293 [Aspergillus brasiliensis CBS 101740]